jgi:hypothetical protein
MHGERGRKKRDEHIRRIIGHEDAANGGPDADAAQCWHDTRHEAHGGACKDYQDNKASQHATDNFFFAVSSPASANRLRVSLSGSPSTSQGSIITASSSGATGKDHLPGVSAADFIKDANKKPTQLLGTWPQYKR